MNGELRTAFWAVIEHHRWWLATDGPNFLEASAEGGLTLRVAQRIAREYSVARNIGAVADDNGAAADGLSWLVERINHCDWPEGLVERARVCVDLSAEYHRRCGQLNIADRIFRPVSAVTKLMWFRHPTGWTMYDRFARIGLIGSRENPELFYRTLAENDFEARAKAITGKCHAAGLQLHGERIVDKLLLFRGQQVAAKGGIDPIAEARRVNGYHLKLLPDERRDALLRLAHEVADMLGDDKFPRLMQQRRKG
jgi:hypothetical protein